MPERGPLLKAISLTNYRCFQTEQRLNLQPITLIYGRNNSGKSALLRALPILARSVAESANSAWDLGEDDGPGRGASFSSVLWRGSDLKSFTLKLFWSNDTQTVFEISQDTVSSRTGLQPSAYIKKLTINSDTWLRVPQDGRTAPPRYEHNGASTAVRFVGLVPDLGQHPALDALRAQLLSLRESVQWLQGGRPRVPWSIRSSGGPPRVLRSAGQNAPQKLFLEQPLLLSGVNRFYRKLQRELRFLEISADINKLLLDQSDHSTWKIELAECGEGMSTVLPILVAVQAAAAHTGPSIVAIEDPEAHLHEDAQRLLAEHLCDVVREHSSIRLLIETHSQTFMLAIQNAVRQGFNHKNVAILWACHDNGTTVLDPIELTESGLPSTSKLQGVFEEDARLAAQLAGLSL